MAAKVFHETQLAYLLGIGTVRKPAFPWRRRQRAHPVPSTRRHRLDASVPFSKINIPNSNRESKIRWIYCFLAVFFGIKGLFSVVCSYVRCGVVLW